MPDLADEIKYQRFTDMMSRGAVYVHLDGRRDDVVIPDDLRDDAELILCFGHNLPVPIPDMVINQEGIAATLSFRRMPQRVKIPWAAVYGLASEEGSYVWPESCPQDIQAVATTPESPPTKRPVFEVVDGGAEDVRHDAYGRPNLRLVKPEEMN